MARKDVLARLAIARAKPGYVATEAIIYLLRAAFDQENHSDWFDHLFVLLDHRIDHNLRRAIRYGSVSDADLRDEIKARFYEILAAGLRGDANCLDPYEVMFDGALAALRISLYQAQRRYDRRKAELAVPQDEGEEGPDEEHFSRNKTPESADDHFGLNENEFSILRNQARGLIDGLPEEIRIAMDLYLKGCQYYSKDPTQMTIAREYGIDEDKARYRVRRGIEFLRKELEGRRL